MIDGGTEPAEESDDGRARRARALLSFGGGNGASELATRFGKWEGWARGRGNGFLPLRRIVDGFLLRKKILPETSTA